MQFLFADNELNSSTLMSLPLFVMAATFMRFGGIANSLVNLASAWLGGLPGSLGLVTVVACTLFAAICGSSVATARRAAAIFPPSRRARPREPCEIRADPGSRRKCRP